MPAHAAGEAAPPAAPIVSPSGRRVAVAGSDSLRRLRELADAGEPRITRVVPSGDAIVCRFLGDDRVATGSLAGDVAIVSFADGRTSVGRHAEYAPVHAIAPAPDGSRLVVACASSAIRVLGSENLEPRATLVGHRDAVFALAWPADSRLYSGSQDRSLFAWDLGAREPAFRELERADGYVTAVAADAQTGRVAYAMGDGRIGVIRAAEGRGPMERVLEGHSAPVQALLFADERRRLISTGNDACVLVWDLERHAPGEPR